MLWRLLPDCWYLEKKHFKIRFAILCPLTAFVMAFISEKTIWWVGLPHDDTILRIQLIAILTRCRIARNRPTERCLTTAYTQRPRNSAPCGEYRNTHFPVWSFVAPRSNVITWKRSFDLNVCPCYFKLHCIMVATQTKIMDMGDLNIRCRSMQCNVDYNSGKREVVQ